MGIGGNWEHRRVEQKAFLGEIDRRTFVKLGGLSAAALIAGFGPYSEKAMARVRFSDYPFKLGVASGDPAPDGVVLWTRLAPEPLAVDGHGGVPDRAIPVRWQVATDEKFGRVVREGTSYARPELAHSVHVEVVGLKPAREYFYRFKAGGEASPTGRTRTLPLRDASPGHLAFAFASCQMYEHGYYTAYKHMAEEDLDLVIHLGDYVYEYGPLEYTADSGNVRRHVPHSEITTLTDYRRRHAQYKTDEDLKSAHAAFPWIVTWDDHEVENNYADEISEEDSEPDQDPMVFLRRRAAAYQAYYEHMPLRRRSMPRGPDARLYRRLVYGNLARFNVLDTRQYRDDQANGDGIDPPSRQTRDPGRTLTGTQQERWLKDGLAGAGATWNVIAQQIFFSELDLQSGPGELFNMDAWDGYEGQRNRLVDFLANQNVRNPVVLTGDIHTNWASDIKKNFDDPGSKTVGTEYVGTSITSDGNGSGATTYGSPIVDANPHIEYFNDRRGYVRCTLTPGEWHSDFRIVPYVNRRGAPVLTAASFVTEAGNPGAQKNGGIAATGRTAPVAAIEKARMEAERQGAR